MQRLRRGKLLPALTANTASAAAAPSILSRFVAITPTETDRTPLDKTPFASPAQQALAADADPAPAIDTGSESADPWLLQYQRLTAFFLQYGHSRVTPSNGAKRLAIWVGRQREMAASGKLSAERTELLLRLNFQFRPKEDDWNASVSKLKSYIALHRTSFVPRRYPTDQHLADFCNDMRRRYKNGDLASEHIAALRALNFQFNPLDALWQERFGSYCQWRSQVGPDQPIPRHGEGDLVFLYEWARQQVRIYKQGGMRPEREAQLRAASFPLPVVRPPVENMPMPPKRRADFPKRREPLADGSGPATRARKR